MKRAALPPMQWGLDAGINVVLFAGLGGACAGQRPVHSLTNQNGDQDPKKALHIIILAHILK